MDYMKTMEDGCVHLTLTDIPYGVVNRDSNGLRNLDKENADVMTLNYKTSYLKCIESHQEQSLSFVARNRFQKSISSLMKNRRRN